jgi:hypothetical protein
MKRMSRIILALTVLLMVAAPAANAALKAFSPNPVTVNGVPIPGLPAWIQDQNGVSVGLCFDLLNCGINGMPGFNPAVALSFPANFPDVPFFFDAVTDPVTFANGSTAFYIAFIEVNWVNAAGALVGSATPGALAVPFQRQRIRVTPPVVPGIWTVATPWGGPAVLDLSGCNPAITCTVSNDFPAPAFGVPQALQNQQMLDTAGVIPGSMSTFLKAAAPAPPAGFLGVAAPVGSFTGAVPPNPNSFTITPPVGSGIAGVTVSTLQLLVGQIFGMEVAPVVNNFGPLPITAPATASAPVTITVTNPDTVNPMTIAAAPAGLVLGGANPTDFSIAADTCSGVTLPAAVAGAAPGACTFTVAFAPLPLAPAPEVANRTATVTIAATASAGLPPGLLALSGTAQLNMAANAGPNGAIAPAGAAIVVNAGAAQSFTVTPNPKFQVKDITLNGVPQAFTKPAKPGDAVTFAAPPATTNGATVGATFMPSGNLTGSGALGVPDALKALRIMAGLVTPDATDPAAMDVAPLGADGRPAGDGQQDLKDVLLILRRAVGVVTW